VPGIKTLFLHKSSLAELSFDAVCAPGKAQPQPSRLGSLRYVTVFAALGTKRGVLNVLASWAAAAFCGFVYAGACSKRARGLAQSNTFQRFDQITETRPRTWGHAALLPALH
jgi:hypothetical protein